VTSHTMCYARFCWALTWRSPRLRRRPGWVADQSQKAAPAMASKVRKPCCCYWHPNSSYICYPVVGDFIVVRASLPLIFKLFVTAGAAFWMHPCGAQEVLMTVWHLVSAPCTSGSQKMALQTSPEMQLPSLVSQTAFGSPATMPMSAQTPWWFLSLVEGTRLLRMKITSIFTR
jgi:hypothetical protein